MKQNIIRQRFDSPLFLEAVVLVSSFENDKIGREELEIYGRTKRKNRLLERRAAGDFKNITGQKWKNLKRQKMKGAKLDIDVMVELGLLVKVEAGVYSINRAFSLKEAYERLIK